MKKFALVGRHLSHSYSPQIHKTIGEIYNLDLDYGLIDIEKDQLKEVIEKLKTGEYHGYNITMPYKMEVMQYLDVISDNAKRIGSINTVYYKDGLLHGDNTDYYGFKTMVESSKEAIENKNVYILGSGGAAKSAYVALLDLKANVTVVKLKNEVVDPMFKQVITYEELNKDLVDIYVNTTPVGMYPDLTHSVLDQSLVSGKIVYDVIYNPEVTQIMSYAKRAYGGTLMLFVQAFYSEQSYWQNKNIVFKEEYLEKLKASINE
ncbi:Shikimate 5-dehydrogenase [Alteracholeplasma palmae J233]|uniref:Shikimate 5-dehydrogenase n=1 Tax=Alteracholeplasma palmae (strain ATCC 49389 / J233) TaxID=1318466 RepID=U4KS74_ALTPJ|nr:shikimate dehydrogenase [Alteracholeplasma palmae]CCV64786.1 Shikimate 5-dehydrogenase [Alteracholeplasma palmae J233]